jgi:hypothetical protein
LTIHHERRGRIVIREAQSEHDHSR